MKLRAVVPLLVAACLVPALAGSGTDSSVAICTNKDGFAKRQEAIDAKVVKITAEKDPAKRKALAVALASAADTDIECLIRYREPALVPTFVEVLAKSKKWFTRTRAIYALKMLGDASAEPALETALSDKDSMVREAAANALGHLGGDAARTALDKQKAAETEPYVTATIDAALGTAGKRPYDGRSDGKVWKETLVGPPGAQRVEWVWVKEGPQLFNDFATGALDVPVADRFAYPVQRYKEDLFAGYPRNSFGGPKGHGAEDHAWFREGCSYYAIGDGVVRMVQGAGGDWGFLVAIEHHLADGRWITAVYGHSAFDVLVHPGDTVKAGQRIATQALSCSVENGGYGSHIHFGLGDGPFWRRSKLATGDVIEFPHGGRRVSGPVLRLCYAKDEKNSYGRPCTAAICKAPDGAEEEVVFPQEEPQAEVSWLQAYIKDCRGWLNPQTVLPDLVEPKSPKGR
jgi:hypothetical protein